MKQHTKMEIKATFDLNWKIICRYYYYYYYYLLWQLVHLDYGEDAEVLLSGVTCTISEI